MNTEKHSCTGWLDWQMLLPPALATIWMSIAVPNIFNVMPADRFGSQLWQWMLALFGPERLVEFANSTGFHPGTVIMPLYFLFVIIIIFWPYPIAFWIMDRIGKSRSARSKDLPNGDVQSKKTLENGFFTDHSG
ncbi:MAG: hypothetical protein GX456_19115 [Verrucomicrobia bacterium]|nr:hypothetical protein [Verrucomicrobiota bacterium]